MAAGLLSLTWNLGGRTFLQGCLQARSSVYRISSMVFLLLQMAGNSIELNKIRICLRAWAGCGPLSQAVDSVLH